MGRSNDDPISRRRGFHFVIGGMWSDDHYPASLAFGMVTQLTGMGMGSSVLSGVFFATIVGSKGMKLSFWSQNGKKLVFVALGCCGLDIFNGIAVAWNIPYAEMIVGSLMTVMQGLIGMSFIKSSSKFITGSMSVMSKASNVQSGAASTSVAATKKANKQNAMMLGMMRMARLLFIGAIGMIIYVSLRRARRAAAARPHAASSAQP